MEDFTHFDDRGQARMVDVGEKAPTHRRALAGARVYVSRDTLALIRDGDLIHIDIEARTLRVDVSGEELQRRRGEWTPVVKPASGWLQLYRKHCTSAHQGATLFWDQD